MVTANIRTNTFPVIDFGVPGAKNADDEWFAEDITISTSNNNVGTTVVIDFSFSAASIIEYTLDGSIFIAFNDGNAVAGGQSRYIRVTNGNTLNFRAKTGGSLIRAVLGEV